MGSSLDRGEQLAQLLTEAGVAATTDPAAAFPPCVLIGPPRRRYDLPTGYTAVWELVALAAPPGGAQAWADLDALADVVAARLIVTDAAPVSYPLVPDAPPAPALLLTYTEAMEG